jgi:hypothetical protein
MVASEKENQEGTFPAIWPVNPLWKFSTLIVEAEGLQLCRFPAHTHLPS